MTALGESPETFKNTTMKMIQRLKLQHISTPIAAIVCTLLLGSASSVIAGRATVVSSAIWSHGNLYGTVATDTEFKSPPENTTDVLFNFAESGLEGQRSVSEAAPGDRDYNGGRWNVMAVAYTEAGLAFFDDDEDGTVDFELTSAEEVLEAAEMGLITITKANFYFVCPLRPQ